jgi:hypothetical protein
VIKVSVNSTGFIKLNCEKIWVQIINILI